MLFSRGVIPDTDGWIISHETQNNEYIRIETGVITEDYLGQYVVINTARQHLDVFVGGELVLSSRDYDYSGRKAARFGLRVTPEFVGKEMQIVFSTPYESDNFLMRNALSFERINAGITVLDYSVTAICIATGIAALVLAFAFGIRNAGSGGICLFALINISLAVNIIRGDTINGYEMFDPRSTYNAGHFVYFGYMLPMLAFFCMTLTGKFRKCAVFLVMSTVLYSVVVFILNAARIVPAGLTYGGYNYILSLTITVLTVMLALQPTAENQFSVIARIHLVLWSLWGFSAVVRLIFSMRLYVNVEYRLVYASTLITLTFYGIFVYAKRIKALQKSEYAMNLRAESLMLSYEQMKAHHREVDRVKHDMNSHLAALHIYLKDKKFEEAEKYLEKYTVDVGDVTGTVYCENYLINAIMHDFLRRAKALGIKADLKIEAAPFNISEPDLCSLLANITDNALEACAKLPDEQERQIALNITRREPYWVVICENSNPGGIVKDGEKINTSKNRNNHGYGLKIIERIAAFYDGMTDVAYDENTFTITVALKDK